MAPSRALSRGHPNAIPLFLAPAFANAPSTTSSWLRPFSSTAGKEAKRKGTRDGNKRRGVSAIRSTGFSHPLAVDQLYKELPKPRRERERPLDEFPTNPNHGLYGFFTKDKDTVLPPEKEEAHGGAWSYHQLTFKSFEDLHALYWKCVLENNRIATRRVEHSRLRLGYGQIELIHRLKTVRTTMERIRRVLLDRQTAYEEVQLMRNREWIHDVEKKVEDMKERDAERQRRSEERSHAAGAPSVIGGSIPAPIPDQAPGSAHAPFRAG